MDTVESLAVAAGLAALQTSTVRDWAAIERSVGGLRLPADYKRLVDGFPHGRFKELVTVIRPGIEGGEAYCPGATVRKGNFSSG